VNEAKALPVGTVRTWANGDFIKTKDGWVPHKGDVATAPSVEPSAKPKLNTSRLKKDFNPSSAAATFAALFATGSEADQKAARQALNRLCSDFGMRDRDGYDFAIGRDKMIVSKKGELPAGVGGIHHWDGSIQVRDKTVRRTGELLSAFARGTNVINEDKRVNAVHTLVHEAVHGHSPIRREQFKGRYRLLEEATTEMAARKVMRDTFGVPWEKYNAPNGLLGAYRDFCKSLTEGVTAALKHKGYTLEDKDADDFIGGASVEMRRRPPPFDDNKDQFLKRFAASLPLSDDDYAKIGSKEDVRDEVAKAVWLSLKPAREVEKLWRLQAVVMNEKSSPQEKADAQKAVGAQMLALGKANAEWKNYLSTGKTESRLLVLLDLLQEAGMESKTKVSGDDEDAGMLPRNDIDLAIAYARVLAQNGKLTGDALRDLALLQDDSEKGIKQLAIAVQRYGLNVAGATE
jgi:hypothetical protein